MMFSKKELMIKTLRNKKRTLRLPVVAFMLLLSVVLIATTALAASVNEDDKLTASDAAAGDYFGRWVAVSGTTVVVGAYGDDDPGVNSGAAYVFNCSSLPCTQVSKLTASDAAAGDVFGFSVAVSGTTAVVGAYGNDDAGSASGAAYVFDLANCGAACNETSKLTASDAAADDWFGISVAATGNMAVVGAYRDDDAGDYSGAAYVFDLASCGTACNEVSKLAASDAAASDYFGYSVAVSGSTAVVGAYGDDDPGYGSGSAYVFDLASCGAACNETSKLAASDVSGGDWFGLSVAVSGTTTVVGAYGDEHAGSDSGSAYVFDLASCGPVCNETSKLTASDAATQDWFGSSVAVSGSTAVVGAYGDDDAGSASGAAYVFDLASCGAACSEASKLAASDATAYDQFGLAVAVSGTTAVVGAYGDDDAGNYSGAAYVFITGQANQAPVADPGGPYLSAVNELLPFDGGASSDPDGDGLTYAWDFGDTAGVSGAAPAHAYTAAEIYDVCLTVSDTGGLSDTACTMAVVYDPTGGFVTGGGWFESPEGAYKADTSLSGKANFGFVSKYKRGATTPTGNTHFEFETAGLEFHSMAYEWLVVSGETAQFKGEGTVNDGLAPSGNPHKFKIWAGDGDPDTLRIKIWDEDVDGNEDVVYDNGTDQSISKGNIIVHKK